MTEPTTTNRLPRFCGLLAATLTPFNADGSVDLGPIPAYADRLVKQGIVGIYINGSTGEGPSLTAAERRQLTEAWIAAINGRIPVMVHIGHTSIEESRAFAEHAHAAGADMLSACAPFYFSVASEERLLASIQAMTATVPERPFYYYHIPRLTGARLDMATLLRAVAADGPASFAGIKFSDFALHDFIECQHVCGGQFELLWGVDEMSLAALATGAQAFIGSTYNLAAPLYQQLATAFEAGDLVRARVLQLRSVELVRVLNRHGGFHASLKHLLAERGLPLGPARLPLPELRPSSAAALSAEAAALPWYEEAVGPAL